MGNWDYNPYKWNYITSIVLVTGDGAMLLYGGIWQSHIPRWTETLGLSEPLGIVKGSSKVPEKTNKPIQKNGESSSDWTLCLLVVLVLLCVFLSLMHDMKTLALSLEVEGESWSVCEGICWGPPCRFQKRGHQWAFHGCLRGKMKEMKETQIENAKHILLRAAGITLVKGVSWCCC